MTPAELALLCSYRAMPRRCSDAARLRSTGLTHTDALRASASLLDRYPGMTLRDIAHAVLGPQGQGN